MTNQPICDKIPPCLPSNDLQPNDLKLNSLKLDSLQLGGLPLNRSPLSAVVSCTDTNPNGDGGDIGDGVINDSTPNDCLIVVHTQADYQATYNAMLDTTLAKIAHKQKLADKPPFNKPLPDELWLVEHSDVYTLGQAGKREHILYDNGTPIIKTDRGGQVTWHGTGQLVVYFLWDLNALGFGVRDLVSHAEQAIEDVLNAHLSAPFFAKARKDAPGVYIYKTTNDHNDKQDDKQIANMLGKIASLGFKIKHGHSYHGIAINLCNDLSAFRAINPCGYAGMTMLRLCDFSDVKSDVFIGELLYNLYGRRQGKIALRAM